MVDIGVTFADDTVPGIDLIYPDPGFIVERKENCWVCVTHAHEDHIGAIAHLWPKLNCKIYTPHHSLLFWLKKNLKKQIDITKYLQIVELNGKILLGSFDIEFITLTHQF